MLTFKYKNNRLECDRNINPNIFHQVGNTIVYVICEQPFPGSEYELENMVCDYMTSSLNNGYVVRTDHVTIELSHISDNNHRYVESVKFQVYI